MSCPSYFYIFVNIEKKCVKTFLLFSCLSGFLGVNFVVWFSIYFYYCLICQLLRYYEQFYRFFKNYVQWTIFKQENSFYRKLTQWPSSENSRKFCTRTQIWNQEGSTIQKTFSGNIFLFKWEKKSFFNCI